MTAACELLFQLAESSLYVLPWEKHFPDDMFTLQEVNEFSVKQRRCVKYHEEHAALI